MWDWWVLLSFSLLFQSAVWRSPGFGRWVFSAPVRGCWSMFAATQRPSIFHAPETVRRPVFPFSIPTWRILFCALKIHWVKYHHLLQYVIWLLLDVHPRPCHTLCHVSFFLTSAKGILPLHVTHGSNFLPLAKTRPRQHNSDCVYFFGSIFDVMAFTMHSSIVEYVGGLLTCPDKYAWALVDQ